VGRRAWVPLTTRTLLVVAACVLAASVVACAASSTSESPRQSAVPTTAAIAPSALPVPSASSVAVDGTPFVSTRYGYGLVVPDGWTVTETPGTGGLHPDEPGVDTYRGPEGRILSVVGEPVAAGTSIDGWTCAIDRHLTTEHETPVESTAPLLVDGQAARLTRFHLHIDPYVIHYLDVELVHGEVGLALSMESTTHDDVADETILRTLLDGLTLT
jgi:hypothetical protein